MTLKTVRDYHAAYKELQQQHFTHEVKLAMLTSYTTDFVLPLLEVDLMASGIRAELYKPHFNQFRQEILDPNSGLYRAAPEVTIVGFNLEDIFPVFDANRSDMEAQILDLCESTIRSYRQYAAAQSRLFI